MKRPDGTAFVVAAMAIAIVGPTGGTRALAVSSSSPRELGPSFGQDAVCAERCNATCDSCDVKCLTPPKDAKESDESLKECTKKCDIDQKTTDSRRWTPKVKACVNACVGKAKPCMKACHVRLGVCLRGCDH